MKEIILNKVHYFDFGGNGLPLIFIHAFPLHSRMWEPQIKFFSDKFRVISYDVRGLGKSKTENNQFTMELYSEDLLAIIEHLKLDKVFGCGLSMGGYILQRSYIKSPDKFRGLILADTRAEADDNIGRINRSNFIYDVLNGKRESVISDFVPKLVSKENFEKPELRNLLFEIANSNSDEGIAGAQLALATRVNSIDYLDIFNTPTLIITGKNDILTPTSVAENMHKLIKGSELKIIEKCGHMSNLEATEEFNNSVLEFIKLNS